MVTFFAVVPCKSVVLRPVCVSLLASENPVNEIRGKIRSGGDMMSLSVVYLF